jgi:hypothetical protein
VGDPGLLQNDRRFWNLGPLVVRQRSVILDFYRHGLALRQKAGLVEMWSLPSSDLDVSR